MNKAEAAGLNALQSTGPRTLAGKAKSKLNALRHGLLARDDLVEGEKKKDFEDLAQSMNSALAPVGALEEWLVGRIVACAWRLRRVFWVEQFLLDDERYDGEGNDCGIGRGFACDGWGNDGFARLGRYEAALERSLFRALHELQRLQAGRSGAPIVPPAVLDLEVGLSGSIGANPG